MPDFQPAKPVQAWEMAAIIVLGIPALYLGIQVFFGSMPLVERFGRFICQHFLGIP